MKKVYHFPLEALGAQDGPFIQALLLSEVSIKPRLDISGFTKLRKLRLHCVQIIRDLPSLLLNCSSLEHLEFISCSGLTELNIPHPLDKLRHLVISYLCIQMVYFHVKGLVHFEYNGALIPIALHGCSNLEKATIKFEQDNKALGNAFDAIPSISSVKMLNIHADMEEYHPVWVSQVHMLTMRPTCMFTNLRYLTCEIIIFTGGPNSYSGLLQLARYLEFSPHLEVLQLHMFYHTLHDGLWSGEVTGEELSCMRRLHHLKTVYMSGFRCYRAQVELLCGILEKSTALELVTIEPKVTIKCASVINVGIPVWKIRQWARQTSENFGKAITVIQEIPPDL